MSELCMNSFLKGVDKSIVRLSTLKKLKTSSQTVDKNQGWLKKIKWSIMWNTRQLSLFGHYLDDFFGRILIKAGMIAS